MARILGGAAFGLSAEFVPSDLRRANATFWLTIGNDRRRWLFRRPEDVAPASIGPPPAP